MVALMDNDAHHRSKQVVLGFEVARQLATRWPSGLDRLRATTHAASRPADAIGARFVQLDT